MFKEVDDATGDVEYTYGDMYHFSDNGGINWFSSRLVERKLGLSRKITFPFSVPDRAKAIYVKRVDGGTEDNPSQEEYVDITGDESEISRLRDEWKKRYRRTDTEHGDDNG